MQRSCAPPIAAVLIAAISTISGAAQASADVERGRGVALGAATAVSPRSACHTCHGLHGAGDRSGAFPRLAGQPAWYLYKQLRDYATGERDNPIMSPIAKALSDRDMQDVAAYYAAQTAAAPPQRSTADPLLLQQGAAISATGQRSKGVAACVNCHGPAGQGLPPSFPYLAGQYAPYIELQFRFWREGKRHNSPLGVMEHIAAQLSDDDVKALAAYFSSLSPPAPQKVAGGR